ncbi:class I adenylate-forming enzyme family protein [Geodermatophilus sp. URMC 64]
MTDLGAELRTAARQTPDRVFLVGDGDPVTFGDLDARADRCAAGLAARGIVPGDRVAVAGLNTVDWLALFFGVTRLGAAVVTLNVRYRETELEYMLGHSGARVVVTPAHLGGFDYRAMYAALRSRLPALESVVWFGEDGPEGFAALLASSGGAQDGPVDAGTPAVVLYTSGTTGRPKGAVLTHGSLLASARGQQERQATGPDDVLVATLPFNHVGGLTCTVLHSLVSRARVALIPAFSPSAALAAGARHGVTILAGVPTMYVLMLAELAKTGHDLSTVRIAVAGGSNVDPPLARAMGQAFPGALVQNLYGLSETSGACVMSASDDDLGTVCQTLGTPLTGVEVRVVDPATGAEVPDGQDGELQVRGDCVAAGYWEMPAETAEAFRDGWLATGDMVTRRPDGHLVLRGRRKEMFLQGGFNVYPVEVENVLAAHPGVALAAGIGVPDAVLGEVGLYFVVPADPASPPTAEELTAWCRERLADYKVPRRFEIRAELPTTPAGKIAKAQLRQEVVPA